MSKPLKPRRGTTAEQNAFVGEAYEVTYDTDKNTLVCRDGLTAGGFPLAKEADLNAFQAAQAAKDAQQDAAIAGKLDTSGGTMTGGIKTTAHIAIEALSPDGFGIHSVVNGAVWDTNFFRLSPDGSVWMRAYDNDDYTDFFFRPNGAITAKGVPINVPAGTVIAFAANKVPDGFLLCNGAAVSRTTYAKLFEAIGTTYGAGDGSSTFALPNAIDRFIQGSTTAGTVKAAGLPNIKSGDIHYYSPLNGEAQSGAVKVEGTSRAGGFGSYDNIYWQHWDLNASRQTSIYGNSTTVQPPAVTMLPCIKY